MKKLFLLLITVGFLSISSQEAKAQALGNDYRNAIGGRFGVANGITFKHFVNSSDALDFIVNFRSKKNQYSTFRLIGLYERHLPINNAPGLRWYYGGGAGIGVWDYKHDNHDSEIALSIDGVLGLDYKFNGAPINASLDWKPALEVTPDTGFDAEGFGLSIRFAF